jgi:hypothetical protein
MTGSPRRWNERDDGVDVVSSVVRIGAFQTSRCAPAGYLSNAPSVLHAIDGGGWRWRQQSGVGGRRQPRGRSAGPWLSGERRRWGRYLVAERRDHGGCLSLKVGLGQALCHIGIVVCIEGIQGGVCVVSERNTVHLLEYVIHLHVLVLSRWVLASYCLGFNVRGSGVQGLLLCEDAACTLVVACTGSQVAWNSMSRTSSCGLGTEVLGCAAEMGEP